VENWVLLLLPVGLLFVVSGLCFVGCAFDTSGLPIYSKPFTTYSDDDVLKNSACVAYWPLNEPNGPTAIDAQGKKLNHPHNGTYVSAADTPAQFPCPSFTAGGAPSAAAPGDLTFAAPGIVIGDAVQPINDPKILNGAMLTNGAFVKIDANGDTNPSPRFSVEAWVKPGWDASQTNFVRTFIDFRASDMNATFFNGFALTVNAQGQWEAFIGLGPGGLMSVPGGQASLSDVTHVVLTCEGTAATLFINGMPNPKQQVPMGMSFVANTTGSLSIGAGGPWLTARSMAGQQLFFPCYPFNGNIQDVAIYNDALDQNTINTHFQNGIGNFTDQQAT